LTFEAELADLSSKYCEHILHGKVLLGSGAFGEVYLVVDPILKKKFALKVMRVGLDKDQLVLCRRTFQQEIWMLQRFRHFNLVQLYGFSLSPMESGGTHYLLYEFVSIGSLESLLKTEEGRKMLTFPRRLLILAGVAQALDFLHMGIQLDPNQPAINKYRAFHRDVKSANIYITSEFGAKLIDCGLGKMVEADPKLVQSIGCVEVITISACFA